MTSEEAPMGDSGGDEVPKAVEAENGSPPAASSSEPEPEPLANLPTTEATEEAAPAVTSANGIAILTQGQLMMEAVLKAGESTVLVELAMSVAGTTPEKEVFGLAILKLMKENQDADPPKSFNAIEGRIQDSITDEMYDNEEFDEWYDNLQDESHPAHELLFSVDTITPPYSDEDEPNDDDNELDDDDDESDGDDDESGGVDEKGPVVNGHQEMNVVEPVVVGVAEGGAQPGPSASARRNSPPPRRVQSQVGQVEDSMTYRERSRSPIDDGDERD